MLRICFPKGSLLITTRATVGTIAIAGKPVATNQGFKNIVPGEKCDSEFYYYCLQTVVPEMKRLATGSTFLEISKMDFERIQIQRPIKEQQVAIANILATADEAIRRTAALIEKLEKIRAGLLLDLLTRGIDGGGRLRDPVRQPDQFSPSPLGKLPKAWRVVSLGSCGDFCNGLNKGRKDFGFGTKFVNIIDVYDERLRVGRLGRMNASATEIAHYRLEAGDILIDRSSVQLDGVGYPTVFEGDVEEVIFCGFIIRLRLFDREATLPRFVCAQMRSAPFRRLVCQVATRSANVNVSQGQLKDLLLALPEPAEQLSILRVLDTIAGLTETERMGHAKLLRMKQGLMQDLLNGRVPVPVAKNGVKNG